jgi:iron complex outermembrane receptor protein
MQGSRALLLAASASGALLAGAPVLAQSAPAPEVQEIQEIVITAEKREQSLLQVPGSVAALGAKAIETQGVRDIADLQFLTPSLSVGRFAGSDAVSIRGIGLNQSGPFVQPGVAINVDGIYQPRTAMSDLDQVDLQRIEVLRGPQGTLYGRNATGGAVNFISNPPSSRLEGSLLASYASYNDRHLQGMLNVPLGDRVRVRGVIDYRNRDDPFVKNVIPGSPGLDTTNTLSGRIRASMDVTEDLTVNLGVFAIHGDDASNYVTALRPIGAAAIAANPVLAGARPALEPLTTSINFPSRSLRNIWGANSEITWDLVDVRIKALSSYIRYSNRFDLDPDAANVDFERVAENDRSATFSQELNLSGKISRLDWILGAFYLDDNLNTGTRVTFPDGLAQPPISEILPGGGSNFGFAPYHTKSYAAFADGTLGITDRLRLIGGARYSRDDLRAVQSVSAGPLELFLAPPPAPPITIPEAVSCSNLVQKEQFGSFTPRAGFQYDVADHQNVYATYSVGFKGGGNNSTACGNQYTPETLTSYEVGYKANILDKTLTLSASAYYYAYKNLQLENFQGLVATVTNAGRATTKGVELEGFWTPVRHWSLNANVSFLNATYASLLEVDPMEPALGLQDVKGHQLDRSPKASGNVGIQYRTDKIDGVGRITVRADTYLTSRSYFREFNLPQDSQGGYHLANLNIVWDSPKETYSARLFVSNLTDVHYVTSLSSSNLVGTWFGNWGAPRQIGLELRARF